MNNNQSGFTLIELLIVIAIIGILAVVLVPTMLSAQQRAYDTSAISCATSLIRAVATYRVDNPSNSAPPSLTVLYGSAQSISEYGTEDCSNMILQDLSQPSGYKFSVHHPRGKNTYTVSDNGITNS